MPVYNGEKYIREAIDSLLNQTFSDLILFISDDASTDNTRKICLEYAKIDQRIRYFKQDKNLGLFQNMKFVLDQADCDFFMWSDCDDIREKDFIMVCVEAIENKKVDVATTAEADIDSFGRNMIELTEISKLSGKPNVRQVTRYVLQPEALGKCNLMYSLFKTDVAKKLWEIYPHKMEWGSDYHFSLAIISHFSIYIDKRILFKKRLGGISSPDAIASDKPDKVRRIVFRNPKNHMFPFGRFGSYLKGHIRAVAGTPYRPLVTVLLLIRLPRSFLIYLKERNYKKFIRRFI